ncbi:hypothetical protein [Arthrobacter sp. H16F315]|uniref:hypothetical protein n=1 Tax=Arthrobacter sp. H16F315 TaxID=2955314 RepID=UPI0020972ADA|nr:hypothetical protein [Arthrobacter sp. H16F315]MDD1477833.1 hypothetical protein [Arthrobacter sp. H16F315]
MAPAAIAVSVFGIGCSPGPGTGDTCVDWVRFATPQDQFDNAILVVVGKPLAQNGETGIYGYKARSHQVEIETVLKGDPGQGSLRVASMPQTCGTSYPDGDPLDTNQRVLIFATKQNSEWFTITPTQGVLPFKQGTMLPFH